jgi:Na+/melibiose symporter-like transporter
MCLVPLIGLAISVTYFMKKYKLDEKTLSGITAELKERQE